MFLFVYICLSLSSFSFSLFSPFYPLLSCLYSTLSLPPSLPPLHPSLSSSFSPFLPFTSLQRTTEIFLFENMLETIPPSIFNIPTLQMLNIDRNHIMQIPPTVSHVTIVHVTVATRTVYMYRLVVASRCMFSRRERMI